MVIEEKEIYGATNARTPCRQEITLAPQRHGSCFQTKQLFGMKA